MKGFVVLSSVLLCLAVTASASPRTGVVSFGGILVKVSVDTDKGSFQIGQSKFHVDSVRCAPGFVFNPLYGCLPHKQQGTNNGNVCGPNMGLYAGNCVEGIPTDHTLFASKTVKIGKSYESLVAVIFLNGGSWWTDEGVPENKCSDVRIKVVRESADGQRTTLINQCAVLNSPGSN